MDDFAAQEAWMRAALERGSELARRLVGETVTVAQSIVDEFPQHDAEPRYHVEFVPHDGAITADLQSHRIVAWTRNGVVVDAGAG